MILFFRELYLLVYHLVIIILSLCFFAVFIPIWTITFVLYRIVRLVKSLWTKTPERSKSIVISGAGSGMGQMIAENYAKSVGVRRIKMIFRVAICF